MKPLVTSIMVCQSSSKPWKFLWQGSPGLTWNPKNRLQKVRKSIALEIFALVGTQTLDAKNEVFNCGDDSLETCPEPKGSSTEQTLRESFFCIDCWSLLCWPVVSSGRLSFQPYKWMQPANFTLTFSKYCFYSEVESSMAFGPQESAMLSNYVEPLGTSEAYNSVTG